MQLHDQPVSITKRLIHVWRVDCQIIRRKCDIAINGSHFRTLAHNLTVDRNVGWNIDDNVAVNTRLARQAAVGWQLARPSVALLDFVERGEVLRPTFDAMLGKVAERR